MAAISRISAAGVRRMRRAPTPSASGRVSLETATAAMAIAIAPASRAEMPVGPEATSPPMATPATMAQADSGRRRGWCLRG